MRADPDPSPGTSPEEEVRAFWASRNLPPSSGILGPPGGPLVREMIGTFLTADPPVPIVQRAVAADVDARARVLRGHRALGILRHEAGTETASEPTVGPLLERLGVWIGGTDRRPYDEAGRTEEIGRVLERLARRGVIGLRESPVRHCLGCGAPRSPERTVYREEIGDTFLVRFPLEGEEPRVDALVWVDAPWRLLGTRSVLLNPDLPYVTVDYRRRDASARLLLTRSAIDRLRAWLPGAELAVVDERPGRTYDGRRYAYPLLHEFPEGADLDPPSGVVHAVSDVGDSGTGLVPLVPDHGGTDAEIAERLGVPRWPILTRHGRLGPVRPSTYAGLDLETANEFVTRDLLESGSVLARLRVVRGVPYCGVCGRTLVWYPARFWCLKPDRLAPQQLTQLERLVGTDAVAELLEAAPWPVSGSDEGPAPGSVALLECDRCERLDSVEGPETCPCGGSRREVERTLVPSMQGALAAWAANGPLGKGDRVRLFVPARRRLPAIVHHVVAMAGTEGPVEGVEVEATTLPTVSEVDLAGLLADCGRDALRAALVRTTTGEGPDGSLAERCRQERTRLGSLRRLAAEVARGAGEDWLSAIDEPGTELDPALRPEDRAVLARWRRAEEAIHEAYDRSRPDLALRRITEFVDRDVHRYRELVRGRSGDGPGSPDDLGVARTLAIVLADLARSLGPVAPFTAETVRRTLRPDAPSLFEVTDYEDAQVPPEPGLADRWERWLALVGAVRRFRRGHGLAADTPLASAEVVATTDEVGRELRADREALERLGGFAHLEVASPGAPWRERRRRLVPVPSEIHRVYPARASAILHLLHHLPPRSDDGPSVPDDLAVVVEGERYPISREMVTLEEVVPERFSSVPLPFAELFVELPSAEGSTPSAPPPLSPDLAWLVHRVRRRLRGLTTEARAAVSLRVETDEPFAADVQASASRISDELGVAGLRVEPPAGADRPLPRVTGRTGKGIRWSVEVPAPEERSRPLRAPRQLRTASTNRRRPVRRAVPVPTEEESEHEGEGAGAPLDATRALEDGLNRLLEVPAVGPAKAAYAWSAGFRSVEELAQAPFEDLARIPGFGRPLALEIFAKLGREVPRPDAEASLDLAPQRRPPLAPQPNLAESEEGPPESPGVDLGSGAAGPGTRSSGEGAPAPEELSGSGSPEPAGARPHRHRPAAVAPASAREAEEELAEGLELDAELLAGTEAGELRPNELASAQEQRAEPAPPGITVVTDEALADAIAPFLEATAAGHRGIVLTREAPERLRALVGPRPVVIYWLSDLVQRGAIPPNDLSAVSTALRSGLETRGVSVVFLEGVERLARIHGTSRLLDVLRALDDQALRTGARIWLHLTPSRLSPEELERIAATFRKAGPAESVREGDETLRGAP